MADIELWFIDLERASAALEAIETETLGLADVDKARLDAMTNAAARRERRLAYIALRILLERRCGPSIRRQPFSRSKTGKPSLASGAASFSLAHTRGCALIALADDGLLGVDIERMRRVKMADARRRPIEQAAVALASGKPLAGEGADSRFLSAWVRIEAVAKAQGIGFGPILERLRPGGEGAAALNPLDAGSEIVAHDVALEDGLFAAVALAPGRAPPEPRTMPHTAAAIRPLMRP